MYRRTFCYGETKKSVHWPTNDWGKAQNYYSKDGKIWCSDSKGYLRYAQRNDERRNWHLNI